MHSRTRHFYLGLSISLRPSIPSLSLSLSMFNARAFVETRFTCTCVPRIGGGSSIFLVPYALFSLLPAIRCPRHATSNRRRAMRIVIERGPWEIGGNLNIWTKEFLKNLKNEVLYIGWNKWFEIRKIINKWFEKRKVNMES